MEIKIRAEVEINGQVAGRCLDEDKVIGPDLDAEFIQVVEQFAWWATMHEIAKDQAYKAKVAKDRIAAFVDHRARTEAKIANEEAGKVIVKLTEKMIENTIITDTDYKAAQEKYIEARKQAGLFQAGREAMEIKRYMLAQIGQNYRAEGMANPVIMQDAVKEKMRRYYTGGDVSVEAGKTDPPPKKKRPGKPNQ